jgi:hypothetical protein
MSVCVCVCMCVCVCVCVRVCVCYRCVYPISFRGPPDDGFSVLALVVSGGY